MNVSLDWDGKELIAMLEAKNYPFWTTQYHYEKPAFFWRTDIYPDVHSSIYL